MGYKSRPFYQAGDCIRECTQRPVMCPHCFQFDKWELPPVCYLSSLKRKAEHEKHEGAYNLVCFMIEEHGPYQKVETDSTWKMLTGEENDDTRPNA